MNLNDKEIVKAADVLTQATKRWLTFDSVRGEFLVLRMPDAATNVQAKDGETMKFWRFDTKAAAVRFRNRQIVSEILGTTEVAA